MLFNLFFPFLESFLFLVVPSGPHGLERPPVDLPHHVQGHPVHRAVVQEEAGLGLRRAAAQVARQGGHGD